VIGPVDVLERVERVEQAGRADLHPLGAQLLAELEDPGGEGVARHRPSA
jgi:hypothetical protein